MTGPRVAQLVIALDHGGLERCVILWTGARNARLPGSTGVLCLDRAGPLAAGLPADALQVLNADRTRFPWDRQAVARLRRHLQANAIDIIHSHNTAARFYAALAVRGTRVKHLYTDHGTNPHLGRGWRDRLRLWMMDAHTDCRVAVSAPAARALAGRQPADAVAAIPIIPNGIDPAPIGDRLLREQLNLPHGAILLGYVGRLAPEKGVDRLLRAFAALPVHCHLAIIGDGPARDALQRQAATDVGPNRIHFTGASNEARLRMPAFDLLLLPSRGEGLPLVLLEAMAEGVPVAATRAGQCPQVLEDGALGLLLPDDESAWPALLATEIEAIRAGRRKATRDAARRHIAATYSLDRTLHRYEAHYRELAGRT